MPEHGLIADVRGLLALWDALDRAEVVSHGVAKSPIHFAHAILGGDYVTMRHAEAALHSRCLERIAESHPDFAEHARVGNIELALCRAALAPP